MILKGKGGIQYNLEANPFAQGGEGQIFNIIGHPDKVAKLYKPGKITPDHERKLLKMVMSPPEQDVLDQIAWPLDVLYNNRTFVGFVMPKFKLNEDLNVIYEYGSSAKYPEMTWGNKVRIAKNLCVVLNAVHEAGHVCGDFNPKNISVDPNSGHITFVDTDSYHITDGGNTYRCNVGMPEYLPREIQVKMHKGLSNAELPTFSQATDNFALAVHIFQLMMNGVHPFACAIIPSQDSVQFPDMSDSIMKGECPFFKNVPGKQIPKFAPSADILPDEIKDLFKKAFITGHDHPEERPNAETWYYALERLEKKLKRCKTVAYHEYHDSLKKCPWCEADNRFHSAMSTAGKKKLTQSTYTPAPPVAPPSSYKPSTASVTGTGYNTGSSTYVGAGTHTSVSNAKRGNFSGKVGKTILTLVIIGAIVTGLFFLLRWIAQVPEGDEAAVCAPIAFVLALIVVIIRRISAGEGGCIFFLIMYVVIALVLMLIIFGSRALFVRDVDDLHTPEILKTYSGSYRSGGTSGDAMITFETCDDNGNITGMFTFISEENLGIYKIGGEITQKKNNGNVTIAVRPGEWIVQPEDFSPLDEMEVKITDNYQTLECSKYDMEWSIGEMSGNAIETADDLKRLAGSEETFQLKNDIDLSGIHWEPIEGFNGTLLGNGYTIRGLSISVSTDNAGLFATLNGVVTSLNIENADVKVTGRHENVGILCGKLESGSIVNVTVSGKVDADTCTNVGGIAGNLSVNGSYGVTGLRNNAEVAGLDRVGGVIGGLYNNHNGDNTVVISKCENTAEVVAKGEYAGGVVGYLYQNVDYSSSSTLKATEIVNTGNVTGTTYVGGIFGYGETDNANSLVQDCANQAVITGECYMGCIAGRLSSIGIADCKNTGSTLTATGHATIDGEKYAYVGGFVGYGYTASNCTNEVTIDYTDSGRYVGGIIGFTDAAGNYSMAGLKNTAPIHGHARVGGIFGGVYNYSNGDNAVDMNDMENTAAVQGEDDYVGGIAGFLYQSVDYSSSSTLKATELVNTGDVTGGMYVGGIFGYGETDNVESVLQDCVNKSAISGECYVGCIGGRLKYIGVNFCENEGSTLTATGHANIDGEKYAYVGGFVGFGYIANNCTNEVTIDYTGSGRYVGGVIGFTNAEGDYSMTDLKNNADISGYNFVGGVIGGLYNYTNSSNTVYLSDFENTATVQSKGNYAGGIVAYLYQNVDYSSSSTLYASDFVNTGTVSGGSNVGGIFGYARTDSKESTLTDAETSSGKIAGVLEGITIK